MLQKRFHMKSRCTNLPHALYQCAPVVGQVGTIFVRRLSCYFRCLDSTRNCHTPSSDAPTDIVLFHTNGNFQSTKCEKMQSKMTKVYQAAPVSPIWYLKSDHKFGQYLLLTTANYAVLIFLCLFCILSCYHTDVCVIYLFVTLEKTVVLCW